MFHTYNICFLIKYFEDILGVEKRGTCIVKDSETDLKCWNECLQNLIKQQPEDFNEQNSTKLTNLIAESTQESMTDEGW